MSPRRGGVPGGWTPSARGDARKPALRLCERLIRTASGLAPPTSGGGAASSPCGELSADAAPGKLSPGQQQREQASPASSRTPAGLFSPGVAFPLDMPPWTLELPLLVSRGQIRITLEP